MVEPKVVLVVLRHAHAAKAAAGQADYDRPLDDRGLREAKEAGDALLGFDCRPARIVCSGSTRTRQTVAGLGSGFSGTTIALEDKLYHDGRDAYLAAARASTGENSLMLVGHNPSVAEFIGFLAGDGEGAALQRLQEGVPPGSFALIEFRTPLGEIANGTGFLRHLFTPTRR